jgi:hypothetical protein
MASDNTDSKSNYLDREENVTKGNLSAKRIAMYYYDSGTDTLLPYTGGSSNPGVVDANNSTTTTLLANATYTGTSTSILNYSSVALMVYANVASATNGVQIQFSEDNTNWDDSSSFSFTPGTAPNQGQAYKSPARAQYYRVVYINGSTNQTTFRLQTVLKTNAILGDSVAIGSTINSTQHSLLATSNIVGKTTAGGGGFVDVKVNPSGALTADVSGSTGLVLAAGSASIGTVGLNAGANAIGSITNTSFIATQATAANLNATVAQSGTWTVGSNSATGSAVPANGFYSGARAATALPTAATAGNLTGLMSDKYGRLVTVPNTVRDLVASQTTTITASTTETTIVTAAASTFNDLTAIWFSNTSGSAVRVDVRDTTAGTVKWQIYIPAGDVRGITFNTPYPQAAVNTNWTAQCSASLTDIRITALFIKNA